MDPNQVQGTAPQKETFPRVTCNQIATLREAIKCGRKDVYQNLVWKNPHYLVNMFGAPTTMQESGPYYNALHFAIKNKQCDMLLTILTTIQDTNFVFRIFPNFSSSKIKDLMSCLLSLFLNLPDETMCFDTPLHLACRYRCDSILAVLLSYPTCMTTIKNKNNLLARELIFAPSTDESDYVKRRMISMFEAVHFLPMMRNAAGIIYIGGPCSLTTTLKLILSSDQARNLYFAFAGPMPLSAVDYFYAIFERKESTSILELPFIMQTVFQMYSSDFEKGFEQVARKLAKEKSIGWIQYWKDLDFWFDLTSIQGFDYLNCYLKKHYCEKAPKTIPTQAFEAKEFNQKKQYAQVNLKRRGVSVEDRRDEFVDFVVSFINEFVQKLPNFKIDITLTFQLTFFQLIQNLVKHLSFMTAYFSDEGQIFHIHEEIGHFLYLNVASTKKESFHVLKFYLSFVENVLHTLMRSHKWKMFFCIMKFAFYFETRSLLSNALIMSLPICDCSWNVDKHSFTYSSRLCYFSIFNRRLSISLDPQNTRKEYVPAMFANYEKNLPVPQESGILSSFPLRSDKVFLNGSNETPLDKDLFHFIEDSTVVINELEKPYFFLWKQIMESKYGAEITHASLTSTILDAVTPLINSSSERSTRESLASNILEAVTPVINRLVEGRMSSSVVACNILEAVRPVLIRSAEGSFTCNSLLTNIFRAIIFRFAERKSPGATLAANIYEAVAPSINCNTET